MLSDAGYRVLTGERKVKLEMARDRASGARKESCSVVVGKIDWSGKGMRRSS
jgi:hypothetical protein